MKYDSDLTDSQWKVIAKIFDDKDINRLRKHLLKEIVDAILYISKAGVQWRLLPKDFPKWQLVYYYFRTWTAKGLVRRIHDTLQERLRLKRGRQASPSLGIVDSQSVKTASMTRKKGIDANKKISGRKRFVVTDVLGLLMAVVIASANTGEREGARLVFKELQGKFPRLEKVLADQGFDGKAFFAWVLSSFGWVLEIVAKVAGIGGFQVLPKRWIVERTFGWFGYQRRLAKDYEEKEEHSVAFIQWSMIRLMAIKLAY